MAGDGITTPRFGFKEMGQESTLEPAQYGAMLDKLDSNICSDVGTVTAGTGVAVTRNWPHGVMKLRLTLTNALVTVDNAAGEYGGLIVATFPNAGVVILGANMNLSYVADSAAGATDTGKIALGTAVAASVNLNAADGNILSAQAFTLAARAATTTVGKGLTAPVGVANGATNRVFLNIAESGSELAANSIYTVNGTIDVFYVDLTGNP